MNIDLDQANAELARRLVDNAEAASPQWRVATLQFRQAATASETAVSVELRSGEAIFATDDADADECLRDIRDAMAGELGYVWFSATVCAVRDGNLTIDFNYDDKPQWDLEPSSEMYVEDHRRHPQPQASLPVWHPAKS